MRALVLLLYNLLLPVALVFALPWQWRKMRRRGGYGERWQERFARYSPEVRARLGKPCWWLHAVSVGEILMALKLVAALREAAVWTGPIVLTTTTSTGRRLAMDRADTGTTVLWTPLDLPGTARRALRVIAPARIILVEAEIWPNLLASARRAGIPVRIVNARLSARSERRFRRFRPMVAPIFQMIDRVCVQDAADLDRFRALGVPDDRLSLTGSIKFDEVAAEKEPTGLSVVQSLVRAMPSLAGKRMILAASTHPGEEKLVASAWLSLRAGYPDTALVVVPRHFERATDAARDLESLGLVPAMRSAMAVGPVSRADCLVVDVTGELTAWYAVASVVVVGKSFAGNEGGQNPAEPVRAGRPVITGPRMDNFEALMLLLIDAGGIQQLSSDNDLPGALRQILAGPEAAAAMAARGAKALEHHSGATARTIALLG